MLPFPPSMIADGRGRRTDYVRRSLTDRCNLRCRFCEGDATRFLLRDEPLTPGEIAEHGVAQIRLAAA